MGLLTMGLLFKTSPIGADRAFSGTTMACFALFASIFVLLFMHTLLLLNNWSTVEMWALKNSNIFKSQAYCYAWKYYFGENCLLWLLPVGEPSADKGLDYEASMPVIGLESDKRKQN